MRVMFLSVTLGMVLFAHEAVAQRGVPSVPVAPPVIVSPPPPPLKSPSPDIPTANSANLYDGLQAARILRSRRQLSE